MNEEILKEILKELKDIHFTNRVEMKKEITEDKQEI